LTEDTGSLRRHLAISFDVGGTFTDFVIVGLDSGEITHRHKVLTNARYPARGVLRGWNDLFSNGLSSSSVGLAVHSTTLVTNAIIERKGARTVLLTTRGFRDILELAREQMYDIYDLFAPPPEPLIPRPMRLEIDERSTADGTVLTAPSEASLAAAIEAIRAMGAESVAVAFLHSYRNTENERIVGERIMSEFPNVTVSLSSDIAPIAGEYERTSTVAADAYTKPLVSKYIHELETALAEAGMEVDLQLVLSSGEISSAESAARRPVRLLESGPASGAMAAAFFGKLAGYDDVLSLDMGGTTAKACVIEGGKPELAHLLEAARVRRFMKGSGLPIVAPVVDLIEIGAGGGSIARKDELGLLKVGPDSSGADPGPACYGLGGELPTVTDANLLLGYLDPGYFLGGSIPLRKDKAEAAVRTLGHELGLSPDDTAWGIHRVVNENMAAAARMHIIERNRDPRSLATIAFGGAGPAHAGAVARLLGCHSVIFPPGAGVASALGALVSPVAFTAGRTLMTRLDQANWTEIQSMYRELENQARGELESAGVTADDVKFHRWAEMRLEGQYHEISVDLPDTALGAQAVPDIQESFARAYARQYGRVLEGLAIETLHWRLTATGPESAVQLKQYDASDESATVALKGSRPVYFPDGGFRDVPVYDREQLVTGMSFHGPAIVEERESTAVIWPGDSVRVDEYLALIVDVEGENA
jgi:N-methylhydantoinase A/oxoprolinase/acetone carboxylase beta subunit